MAIAVMKLEVHTIENASWYAFSKSLIPQKLGKWLQECIHVYHAYSYHSVLLLQPITAQYFSIWISGPSLLHVPVMINYPLMTSDWQTHHLTWPHYRLVYSALKIGSLAERWWNMGEIRRWVSPSGWQQMATVVLLICPKGNELPAVSLWAFISL